jgi:hypothetical protein
MSEVWKSVVGYEGFYEVSDQGRVRSLDRISRDGSFRQGVLLRRKTNLTYPCVGLSKDGKARYISIHRLVLLAFAGPAPDGMVGCHINGIASDARLVNLRWATASDNEADKKIHGTRHPTFGEHSGVARFCNTDIERMFDLEKCGEAQKDIAKYFDANPAQISMILSGKRWGHLGYKAGGV